MVRRHEIQVLRRAGHSLDETAKLVGVSQSSVQRIGTEPVVTTFDTDAERARREVGRPSKAEPFRSFLVGELAGSRMCCPSSYSAARNSGAVARAL